MIKNFIHNQDSQVLFNRAYSFILGKKGDPNAIQFQNFWSKDTEPSPLRIVFEVEKNFIGTPNKTKFQIYNLSLETRSQIKAGHVLELRAGYTGLIDRIFFGQVGFTSIKSVRNGSDIITSLECMDGAAALLMTRINKSYPPGTKLYQIIEDILEEMSLETDYNPVPLDNGLVMDLPDISFPRGKTIHGTCKDALNDLLKNLGLDWSIQNNSLVILPIGRATNQSAIEIGPESGLIGIPTRNGIYFEFKSLLNPQLRPGIVVKLVTNESSFDLNKDKNEALAGFYIINIVKYNGDTYGNDWTASCQCRAINANEIKSINTNISTGSNLLTSVKTGLA